MKVIEKGWDRPDEFHKHSSPPKFFVRQRGFRNGAMVECDCGRRCWVLSYGSNGKLTWHVVTERTEGGRITYYGGGAS